ncbi:TPA: hypothetical protein N0F65_008427 [Lagenidium giganteum]|uniref:HORMA domain-containing protein n=1 Tax=Lagenidium giganteum TaxID=4803 RepID=A0AAV2YWU6_9STRA|nr:TPA: hypothetical protein N0F65_008427 [Lagenidium giganteum]
MGRTRASTQAATAQLSKSITHLQSLNVMLRVSSSKDCRIRVSVSEICYLRSTLYSNCFDVDAVGLTIHALQDLFPPDLFKERVYADMQIKCLAPTKDLSTPDTENAWLVTQWLEEGGKKHQKLGGQFLSVEITRGHIMAVFEALNKKYLEALMLGVYALRPGNEPGKLLESYTYNIQHGESGGTQLTTSFAGEIPIKYTAENVKDQAIQLIRSLVSITTNLDPLPPNRLITMKLTFNSKNPSFPIVDRANSMCS